MSAVYLHHSLYTPEVMPGRSRNQSIVSSATIHTNTTFHTNTTEANTAEALLRPQDSSREIYYDDPARGPQAEAISPGSPAAWHSPNPLLVASEKSTHWGPPRRKASRRWHWIRLGLETILGGWAVYNAVRYFLAFTIFESTAGQTVSLALGVSSSLGFAFLVCAVIISWFQPRLLFNGLSYRSLTTLYWLLNYVSFLFLFAPAAINFALVFAWRDSDELQLRTKYRCYVDIDVVWSTQPQLCRGKAAVWGFWIVISTLRLLITAGFICAYYLVLVKIRRVTPMRSRTLQSKHRHKPSDTISYHSAPTSQQTRGTTLSAPLTSVSQVHLHTRQLSGGSNVSSRTGLSPRPLRSSRSHSSEDGRTASSSQIQFQSFQNSNSSGLAAVPEQEADLGSFSDHFSLLVSQIHRETDEAIELAQSDSASSKHTIDSKRRVVSDSPEPLSDDEEEEEIRAHLARDSVALGDEEEGDEDDEYDGFYARPAIPPTLGYNEFGQPYPVDTELRMMNGYVRRMPTIESMGSREMGSSIAASSLLAQNRHSYQTNMSYRDSRPPTRNTLISMVASDGMGNGSEPSHSRPHSLTVQAERLAALGLLTGQSGVSGGQDVSEVGEIVDTVQSVKIVPPPENPSHLNLPMLDHLNSTAGSRSTNFSYHTATMGSGVDESVSTLNPPGLYAPKSGGGLFFDP
ncbi:hypothetical protein FA15DRAFT_610898 [Coprinopsis marcescibilis]|uniref:Uncharacterized protein n=1 Tax=Coprinopsis marcescibilis TaxID=230819 RepID=A0A5C3LAW1_COPMA|nr:hypothetical protein FA15DRAFT_610898 [Coprinopsis marcescibilis]